LIYGFKEEWYTAVCHAQGFFRGVARSIADQLTTFFPSEIPTMTFACCVDACSAWRWKLSQGASCVGKTTARWVFAQLTAINIRDANGRKEADNHNINNR
jgi:hypothetical protein